MIYVVWLEKLRRSQGAPCGWFVGSAMGNEMSMDASCYGCVHGNLSWISKISWDFMTIPRDFRRFSNLKPTKYREIEIFEVAVIPGSAWSPGGARSGRRNSRSWRRRSWWKNSHRGSLQSPSSGPPHAGLKRAILMYVRFFLTSPVETLLKSAKTIHDENTWSKFSLKTTTFPPFDLLLLSFKNFCCFKALVLLPPKGITTTTELWNIQLWRWDQLSHLGWNGCHPTCHRGWLTREVSESQGTKTSWSLVEEALVGLGWLGWLEPVMGEVVKERILDLELGLEPCKILQLSR